MNVIYRSLPGLRSWLLLGLVFLCALLGGPARAQGWPRQPLTIVVNHPIGSPADQLARALATPLEAALGQPVNVDNEPGPFSAVAGNAGAERVSQAVGDGYTLLLGSHGVVTVNPYLYKALGLVPRRDLAPVAALASVPTVLLVSSEWGVESLPDLLGRMKEQRTDWVYASTGMGSSDWLVAEMFKQQAKVFAIHLPYRDPASANAALLAGHADFWFDQATAMAQVRSRQFKALAISSAARSPLYPGTPTMKEAGVGDLVLETVYGLYAPASTPVNVITRLNREVNRILATSALKKVAAGVGAVTMTQTPAEFAQRQSDDAKRYSELIRKLGVRAD